MSATRIQPDSRLNAWLDTTIGLAICVKGHRVGSWTALMSLGAALGSTIWVLLAYARALPTALVASLPIAVAAIAAIAIRRSRSGHRVVCHRYAAVSAALAGGLAWVTSAPVLLTFDVWTVSMIAGLALGRLGCHRRDSSALGIGLHRLEAFSPATARSAFPQPGPSITADVDALIRHSRRPRGPPPGWYGPLTRFRE